MNKDKQIEEMAKVLDYPSIVWGMGEITEKGIAEALYNAGYRKAEPEQGHWIEENRRANSSQFICSKCGLIAYFIQRTRDRKWTKHCPYQFCPHCGIKMETKGD